MKMLMRAYLLSDVRFPPSNASRTAYCALHLVDSLGGAHTDIHNPPARLVIAALDVFLRAPEIVEHPIPVSELVGCTRLLVEIRVARKR
jgi:hypothetical protein